MRLEIRIDGNGKPLHVVEVGDLPQMVALEFRLVQPETQEIIDQAWARWVVRGTCLEVG